MDFNELPLGFGMALAMNPTAMNTYCAMDDKEKEEILNKVHGARSKKEMHQIVNALAANSLH